MVSLPEETEGGYSQDGLRRELEGKIEKRLPSWVFMWVTGGIVAIAIAVLTIAFSQISSLSEDLNEQKLETSHRITILETKIDLKR